MGRPSLVLVKEPDTEGDFQLVHDPIHEDQWTIFFRMKIKNEGDNRAQNWRVWFTPLDDSTWVLFDPAVAREEAYLKDKLTGRCETILDEKTRVSDFCIEPHEVKSIPGRHSIVFKGKPSFIDVQFKLNADHMKTMFWEWRIIIDWKTHSVRWNEHISSEREQSDPSQPLVFLIHSLQKVFRNFRIFGG
jgi:hypothetical protein